MLEMLLQFYSEYSAWVLSLKLNIYNFLVAPWIVSVLLCNEITAEALKKGAMLFVTFKILISVI